MILRLATIISIISTSAAAQFFGLATPSDGSRLYFSTPLRQKNTMQPTYGKLFRIDSGGLNLQESRIEQPPDPVPSGIAGVGMYHLSNAYDLQSVDVSSDGQVLAAAGFRDCNGDLALCAKGVDKYVTTITAAGHSQDFSGKLRLSANGKWAFGSGSLAQAFYPLAHLVNLTTGEETTLTGGPLNPFQVASGGRPVANDGTAVYCNGDVVIVQGAAPRRIRTPISNGQPSYLPLDAVIDADARTVVYSAAIFMHADGATFPSGTNSLYVADVSTGESTMLASDGYAPSLSGDGRTVLYLSKRDGAPQAWLIQPDGSSDRRLTEDPLGIARAILSGDGSIAYAVTLGGRLLKIAVPTGKMEEIIPRTPFVDSIGFVAPGKLVSILGEGLSEFSLTAAPPLPYELDNIRVTIQGKPTRIFSIQPTAITILTPPDVVPTNGSVEVDLVSPSPFAVPLPQVGSLYAHSPEFLVGLHRPVNPYMLVAHEDWSGLVNPGNPALPGEVIHAYAVGLGPTSPEVPYGSAAPAREPLARVVSRYPCTYGFNPSHALEILFEGLAPELAGIYQIDFRVPPEVPDGDLSIFCQASEFDWLGGTVPVRR